MLGRMIALTGGDEGLARIVMPLMSDTLASQTSGADAEVGFTVGVALGEMGLWAGHRVSCYIRLNVPLRTMISSSPASLCQCSYPRLCLSAQAYAVAAHSLASMAICCAVHDRQWGYDHVRGWLHSCPAAGLSLQPPSLATCTPCVAIGSTVSWLFVAVRAAFILLPSPTQLAPSLCTTHATTHLPPPPGG